MRSSPTRIIAGKITAAGAPATGGGYTSRKIATGQYTISVAPARLLSATGAPSDGGIGPITIDTFTDTSFRAVTSTPAGSAQQDSAVAFAAVVAA